MKVLIGSARRDENGKYTGGKRGDQLQKKVDDYTGEVSIQSFYVHQKGWMILRAKSISTATKIAYNMRTACNNSNIGYNQSDRYSVLYYPLDTQTHVNCDCSSLVRACIKYAIGKDIGDFTTANEVAKLVASNLFDAIEFTNEADLYIGDILVTKTKGHTVIVVSGKSRTAQHFQLQYKKGDIYTVNEKVTSLNVRAIPITGKILRVLKGGQVVTCQDVIKVGDAIWMYLGKDTDGKEQWCCADNGKVQYIG